MDVIDVDVTPQEVAASIAAARGDKIRTKTKLISSNSNMNVNMIDSNMNVNMIDSNSNIKKQHLDKDFFLETHRSL